MDAITITPIAGALGAEIGGVDLSRGFDRETLRALRQALLDHLVIFFRDQDLTPDGYLAFAKEFGTPSEYPLMKGIEGYPFIQKIEKLASQRWNFAGTWHSDTTYLDCPPSATLLRDIELPPFGGDTMYANQYLAYETLSEPLRLDPHGQGIGAFSAPCRHQSGRSFAARLLGRDHARVDLRSLAQS